MESPGGIPADKAAPDVAHIVASVFSVVGQTLLGTYVVILLAGSMGGSMVGLFGLFVLPIGAAIGGAAGASEPLGRHLSSGESSPACSRRSLCTSSRSSSPRASRWPAFGSARHSGGAKTASSTSGQTR